MAERTREENPTVAILTLALVSILLLTWATSLTKARTPEDCLAVVAREVEQYRRSNALSPKGQAQLEAILVETIKMLLGSGSSQDLVHLQTPPSFSRTERANQAISAKLKRLKNQLVTAMRHNLIYAQIVCTLALFLIHATAAVMASIMPIILGALMGTSLGLTERAKRERALMFIGKTYYTGTWSFFASIKFLKLLTIGLLVLCLGTRLPIPAVQIGIGSVVMLITRLVVGKLPRI